MILSCDLDIPILLDTQNDTSLYLPGSTSPMETADFVHEQTEDLTNQSEFDLNRETQEISPESPDPHSDHLLYDESTKDSLHYEGDSPPQDFPDLTNLEPQDNDPYIPQEFDDEVNNLAEQTDPDFIDNSNPHESVPTDSAPDQQADAEPEDAPKIEDMPIFDTSQND